MTSRRGFSLIELLVVIAIVGTLVAVLLPVLTTARKAGQRSVCLNNLHQIGLATNLYLNDFNDQYWRYFWQVSGGRRWWFGFEAGGPGTGTNRPLDLSQSFLAGYFATLADQFQCPSFPYDTPGFYEKFDHRAATYGYNWKLGPFTLSQPVATRSQFIGRESSVFVFADSIFFEPGSVFQEGYYLDYTSPTTTMSGYAHFRHLDIAQLVLMDGHAESQQRRGSAYTTIAGGAAGNLSSTDGSNQIYGF